MELAVTEQLFWASEYVLQSLCVVPKRTWDWNQMDLDFKILALALRNSVTLCKQLVSKLLFSSV